MSNSNDEERYYSEKQGKEYKSEGGYETREEVPITRKKPKAPPPKGKRTTRLKGLVIIIIALLLIAVFMSPLFGSFPDFWGGGVYPEKAKFTIKRTIEMEADSEISYTMDLPVPESFQTKDGKEIQTIRDLEWGGDPTTQSKYGNDWMIYEGDLQGQESVVINYHVTTETIKWGHSAKDSGNTEDIDDVWKQRYNGDQWEVDYDGDGNVDDRDDDGRADVMIEPNHPDIKSLAEDITAGEQNIYNKSKAIYDWLESNIDYRKPSYKETPSGLPKHAIWTYRDGAGDCDEQSFLYCSLCRAVDIPAWIELGVLYDRVRDAWDGHGWVRQHFVSEDGDSGWVNIDPVNNQFFARDATRLTTWVDDGLSDSNQTHLEDYYEFFTYTISVFPPNNDGRPRLQDVYENTNMETEGQVSLDDDDQTPGFGLITFLLAIGIITLTFKKVKRRKREEKPRKFKSR